MYFLVGEQESTKEKAEAGTILVPRAYRDRLSPKGEHHFSQKNFTAPQLYLPKANITDIRGNGVLPYSEARKNQRKAKADEFHSSGRGRGNPLAAKHTSPATTARETAYEPDTPSPTMGEGAMGCIALRFCAVLSENLKSIFCGGNPFRHGGRTRRAPSPY